MPANRNALIRYKTIDQCLQNRYRRWTLENLIDACSDALYEYEGIDKGVSKRTVQNDIQIMRSDKLGYNAPIVVEEKKYYTYQDADYSITNIPLSEQDLGALTEAVEFMKQFQGFSHFQNLDGMVQKLEDHIYSQKTSTKPVIDFEKNENLKGLEFLDPLYRAIINKRAVVITYQSFSARQPNSFVFHSFLLKEFRNRWFVLGVKNKQHEIMNLALDRIHKVETSDELYRDEFEFDAEKHFEHAMGVSVSPTVEVEEVVLFANHAHAPYISTKPLHHTQKEIARDHFGVTFSIHVQQSFELEKEILSFGEALKVISPSKLKRKIKDRLQEAVEKYETEINESKLRALPKRLLHKGFGIFNYVYSRRETRKTSSLLQKQLDYQFGTGHEELFVLNKIPELKEILLNRNLSRIINEILPNSFVVHSRFVDIPRQGNVEENWQQHSRIFLSEKSEGQVISEWETHEGFFSAKAPQEILDQMLSVYIILDEFDAEQSPLQIVPGSQNKLLSSEEIELITQNSIPFTTEMQRGGVLFAKPLLLHRILKSRSHKMRRYFQLWFYSGNKNKLKWAEQHPFS